MAFKPRIRVIAATRELKWEVNIPNPSDALVGAFILLGRGVQGAPDEKIAVAMGAFLAAVKEYEARTREA